MKLKQKIRLALKEGKAEKISKLLDEYWEEQNFYKDKVAYAKELFKEEI